MERELVFESNVLHLQRKIAAFESEGFTKDPFERTFIHNGNMCVWMIKEETDDHENHACNYMECAECESPYLESEISYCELCADDKNFVSFEGHQKVQKENETLKENYLDLIRINASYKQKNVDLEIKLEHAEKTIYSCMKTCPDCKVFLDNCVNKYHFVCKNKQCLNTKIYNGNMQEVILDKYQMIKTNNNMGLSEMIDPEKEKIVINKSAAIGMAEVPIKLNYFEGNKIDLFDMMKSLYSKFKLFYPTSATLEWDLIRWNFNAFDKKIYICIKISKTEQLFDYEVFNNDDKTLTWGNKLKLHTVKQVLKESIRTNLDV